jgi:hypothetical protein
VRPSGIYSSLNSQKPPKSSSELHEELARLRAERLARKGGASGAEREGTSKVGAELISSRRAGGDIVGEMPEGSDVPPAQAQIQAGPVESRGVAQPTLGTGERWDWVSNAGGRVV